jgi:hypothetical protein
MSNSRKAKVDFQFLLGDTLIKAGTALIGFTVGVALLMGMNLREAAAEGMWGYVTVTLFWIVLALVLWQWGRSLRRDATIADIEE